MFVLREFFETEKKNKNGEWANKVITFLRLYQLPLVSQNDAEVGMSYLLGCQDMTPIKNLFQNVSRINLTNQTGPQNVGILNRLGQPVTPSTESDQNYLREMQSLNFKPLPILEKLRNVLIAEMKKMGPVVNVRSEDPVSTAKKLQDKQLLEHRNEIEGFLSYIYTSIGQKPFKMKEHKARFGDKPDAGNTQQFDAMGLNPGDPADVNFFMENFHKLDEEIALEAPINFSMSYNRVIIEFEKWVNDAIAKKAVAATCYVDNVSGLPKYKYLAPETVYVYGSGNEQDFSDAQSKAYERKVTIKELIEIIGNSFDIEKEWDALLQAITNTMKIEFTGVKPSYRGWATGNGKLTSASNAVGYNYDQFMSFKVTLGYIEFCSQDLMDHQNIKDGSDGFYQNNQSPTGKYPTKARWETPYYKAYYLAVSQVEQVLFDFGELQYQDILGASDTVSNFTIITYKDIGDPIAIQAAQIIDMVNEAWYKFRYELRRAKPRGRGWNYDSMVTTLMDLIPDTNSSPFNKLQKVMEMLDSSANEIYTFPMVDGKTMPLPGNQLNYDIPNGMSKESMLWWEIMMNGIQYISDMIGVSPLREGDPGNPRDSMNNQFKALEYSQAATYYIPDMLTYMLQQLAVKTNFYVQDIVTYKDYNTVSYKALEDALGEETLNKLEGLGKTAPHRFGIFVESLNQGPLRQKLDAILFEAVKNKSITTAEYLLINDIKSVKKAIVTFAYFEQRNRKLAEQSQQQAAQQQQQAQQQNMQMQMAIEQKKIDAMILGKQIDANAGQQEHLTNQIGGITKTKMKIEGDIQQLYHGAMADFLAQQQKLNATPSAVTPPPPPPMPQQAPPGNIPQQAPGDVLPSAAGQLRQNVEPQSTGANLQ